MILSLALGCLCSCQQQEKEEIHFSINNDGLDINLNGCSSETRSLVANSTGKTSISAGDIISLGNDDSSFTPFIVDQDVRTWQGVNPKNNTVNFYAHYPEIGNYKVSDERIVEGGQEYIFGKSAGEVTQGTKTVALNFKRMTVPVILLDINGNPYKGGLKIMLNVVNKGTQDLQSGIIKIDNRTTPTLIEAKKLSEGGITNIIPQSIDIEKSIGTTTIQCSTNPSARAIFLDNSILKVYVNDKGIVIVDGETPLRR